MRNIERGIQPTGNGYNVVEVERDRDGKVVRRKLIDEKRGKRAYLAATRLAGTTTVIA